MQASILTAIDQESSPTMAAECWHDEQTAKGRRLESAMKGVEQKKKQKKQPLKTAKEKKAEKLAKKAARGQ